MNLSIKSAIILCQMAAMTSCGRSSKTPSHKSVNQTLEAKFSKDFNLAEQSDEKQQLYNYVAQPFASIDSNPFQKALTAFHRKRMTFASSAEEEGAHSKYEQVYAKSLSLSRAPGDPKFKSDFEQITSDLLGDEPLYNSAFVNIFDPLTHSRQQCSSGSFYHYVLMRPQVASRLLFIFRNGHILPGYLVEVKGEPHLIGYETTLSGEARIDFGPPSKISRAIRVVKGHYYVFSKIFADDLLNPVEVAKKALEETAQEIGLNLALTEAQVASPLYMFHQQIF